MPKIRLARGEWEFDARKRLGPPGGFGEVFRGTGPQGPVAVKRLKLDAGHAAHRELRIGEHLVGRPLSHVVPVLDAGQDAASERYFIVMPVCDRTLQDEIAASSGGVPIDEALSALQAIVAGLLEVGDLVHRDLKPANVLLHEGTWKIADFGVAKFVEDATSLKTVRDSLTRTYAAPEQWRGERPTHATDVYALGCIAHALATGSPPFQGSLDDVRQGHLQGTPPSPPALPARLASLVSFMLRKAPAGRPTLARCAEVLISARDEHASARPARAALSGVAAAVAEREAREEAETRAEATRQEERQQLLKESVIELVSIRKRLFAEIQTHALGASRVMHTVNVAYGPFPIDGENEGDFINRWIELFSEAAAGQLHRPNRLPVDRWCS